MSDLQGLLEAGALLDIKQKIKGDIALDPVSARSYEHRALPTPTVRLTPDNLAEGDDLEMAFLGFSDPAAVGPLAQRRRQALGFPAWAMINDPDHARYALEVVKDMKRETRRSKSKPGHAYDGFVAIAKQLGRSVVHFLPSFWEEVGRVFLAVGNSTYASRAFNQAREAERVHALDIDENTRRDAFLEFALVGALTTKALTEYSKELADTLPPNEAWSFYRELCLRRTLGGMPPWATMHRDLDRLLKATDLDFEAERRDLLGDLLFAPSIAKAPEGFWKGYSQEIKSLASVNPEVAGQLLNLHALNPNPWLELLDSWDLLKNLWEECAPGAGPRGSVCEWLRATLTSGYYSVPLKVLNIVAQAAEKMREEDIPFEFPRHRCSVDLLDLMLELKIPVADPTETINTNFVLNRWWQTDPAVATPENHLPRDLRFLAADERFKPHLQNAVKAALGEQEFDEAAKRLNALVDERKACLLELLAETSEGAVYDCEQSTELLANKTTKDHFVQFPEAFERLREADIGSVLHHTLQTGILDEFGWPALEEVVDSLSEGGKNSLTFSGQFPYVLVFNGIKVVVVGRDSVVDEHEVKLPKGHRLEAARYIDNQVVVYHRKTGTLEFYWSDDPKKQFPSDVYNMASEVGGCRVPLPNGGDFDGARKTLAGDNKLAEGNHPFFDGEHYWGDDRDSGYDRILRQWDPDSGKLGRQSLPSFLEQGATTEGDLEIDSSHLLHFGELVSNSPLGSVDGLVGFRVKRNQRQEFEIEGVDGRRWTGKISDNRRLSASSKCPPANFESFAPSTFGATIAGVTSRCSWTKTANTSWASTNVLDLHRELGPTTTDKLRICPWCIGICFKLATKKRHRNYDRFLWMTCGSSWRQPRKIAARHRMIRLPKLPPRWTQY